MAAAPSPAPPSADDRFAAAGLAREELSFLIRLAFAGATRGRVVEARAINAAAQDLAPDHACWAIGEYLCLTAEGHRQAALDVLETTGLGQARAWEQAAELLLLEIAEGRSQEDIARRERVTARLSSDEAGRAALAAAGLAPALHPPRPDGQESGG